MSNGAPGGYYRLNCPKCGGQMKVRASAQHHMFLRVMYLSCQYALCNWAVKADLQMTHELSPSLEGNPSVSLPLATSAIRLQAARDHKGAQELNQFDLIDLLDAQEANA